MFAKLFRLFDKFFVQLKYLTSFVTFIFIALALLMFIYWLIYSANITIPYPLYNFIWGIIDFFAQGIKSSPNYNEIIPILPVLTSGIFIIATYITNCFMVFLENNHKNFHNTVKKYRENLEQQINKKLHKDFVDNLKKNSYMLVGLSIDAVREQSYLSEFTDDVFDANQYQSLIEHNILNSVNDGYIIKKGISGGIVYFLISDMLNSREFISEIVNKSAIEIKKQLKPKVNVSFFCALQLLESKEQLAEEFAFIKKLHNTKIKNKVLVSPKFKMYFDEMFPKMYQFDVVGQYNFAPEGTEVKNVMVYALRRNKN